MPLANKQNERILGIDPGFGRAGWGVVEKVAGVWQAVACGCVETKADLPFKERLIEIHQNLKKIIAKYRPTRAAVEDLFFAKNVKTAMQVGEARGVIILTLVEAGLMVDEFTPLQVKQAMTGYGRAEKGQVQRMLRVQLNIKKKITSDDAIDALAVALTCGVSLNAREKMGK